MPTGHSAPCPPIVPVSNVSSSVAHKHPLGAVVHAGIGQFGIKGGHLLAGMFQGAFHVFAVA